MLHPIALFQRRYCTRPIQRQPRRGVVALESALVLSTLMLILLTIVDLGLAVLHYNTLSDTARRLARESIVHGEFASPERTVWGPNSYSGTAGDGSAYAATVKDLLVALDLNDVKITVDWPDAGNAVGQRVQVVLRYSYRPMMTLGMGDTAYEMSATSTMRIAH